MLLVAINWSLCVVCCLVVVVGGLRLAVRCSMFVVCRVLFVVCCFVVAVGRFTIVC